MLLFRYRGHDYTCSITHPKLSNTCVYLLTLYIVGVYGYGGWCLLENWIFSTIAAIICALVGSLVFVGSAMESPHAIIKLAAALVRRDEEKKKTSFFRTK